MLEHELHEYANATNVDKIKFNDSSYICISL